jgi:hypothetical protein
MIKLEITVLPKSSKYLEFSQSMESIKSDLEQLCNFLQITEEDKAFKIILGVGSIRDFTIILHSKELSILSGAIRTLAEKSKIIIHGAGYKRRNADLSQIRLDYS